MKRSRIPMGALLCALLVLVLVTDVHAQETEETKPHCIAEVDPFGDPDQNTLAIQECADKTYVGRDGSTKKMPVFIPCGDYWITRELRFINVPLWFAWGPPDSRGEPCRVRLIAHPKLKNQRIFFFYSVVGSEIGFIELDGNKIERMRESMERDSVWPNACDPDDQRPANAEVHGANIKIHDFASRNAICGAGIGILATRLRMWNSVIEDNGFAEGAWPFRGAQFADGVTSLFCEGCEFSYNQFRNNTDLDFVLGGGSRNWVHHNECTHDKTYGFACFNWGQFSGQRFNSRTRRPWDGNHEGTVVEENVVFAVENMLAHGFAAGKDAFEANPTGWLPDAGTIRFNRSTGAKHNFTLDGVQKIVMYGNIFREARGTRKGAYSHCAKAYNFTAAHFGREASIQPGYDSVSLDGGICKTER